MSQKPNIIYIHSHDTGRYIQPYGHAVPTPNLQRLAEDGMLFRQCFTVNPTCSPSRAALLTGCWPHQNGMFGLAHRGWSLNNYEQHLVHQLKAVGYDTALSGMQHIANMHPVPWETIGYDKYLGNPGEAADKATEYIREYNCDKPFFLAVGFHETHREFPRADERDNPAYCLPPAPLPDTPETRQDMAEFKASARAFDEKVGQVMAALEEKGITDNTLVICTTDHGIAFPQMKCNLTDHGTGVMLIIRGPGGFTSGKVTDAMVTHMDIFPTVCELLGIPEPGWLEGKSLCPLAADCEDEIHSELFFEINFHAAFEPMRAVRTNRYKYIRRYLPYEKPILPNCDAGYSKTFWLEHGWEFSRNDREELYDLVFDPQERKNLAAAPEMRKVLSELRQKLDEWMKRTEDPLLTGSVSAPAGTITNPVDGREPRENPETLTEDRRFRVILNP